MSVERAKIELEKAVPPGWRPAECCGTCKHWEFGHEGEGECTLWPDTHFIRGGMHHAQNRGR